MEMIGPKKKMLLTRYHAIESIDAIVKEFGDEVNRKLIGTQEPSLSDTDGTNCFLSV